MRLNFKKVSAIAASALMMGLTMGTAAAANYPNPFVVSGVANVAIVYGTGSGVSSLDLVQAGNIQGNLQSFMTGSTGGSASVTGEAVDLGTSGTRIYVNDSLNLVKTVLTSSDLPTVLADTSFSGNVDTSGTQTIDIGSNPRVTFAKQPTSDDDPNFALTTSSTQANYIYNETVSFNKAINFTHADSEGQDIVLFGQKYTVSSATSNSQLVLLQSAEKVSLDSNTPSATVTIAGATYTVELVSASDTSATIKVTDASGTTDTKEINEAASKKLVGITVAVTSADENNLKYSASIVAGSEKLTFIDGSSVEYGEEDTVMDGTLVEFGTGNPNNLTTFSVSVYAADSENDAIKAGTSFVDPVFKTVKLDFAGLNIADDSTSRENIVFSAVGDDRESIKFTDHRNYEKVFTFAQNTTGSTMNLMYDSDAHNISVAEMKALHYQDYTVVGNEQHGYLVKISSLKNQTTGFGDDYLKFTDVFSGDTYETVFSADGTGTVSIGGKSYTVTMTGNSANATEEYTVRINDPESTTNDMIIYPTIQTSKGAKVMLYTPLTITLDNWNGGGAGTNVTNFDIPDGDGYTAIAVSAKGTGNYTIGGATNRICTGYAAGTNSTTFVSGPIVYNATSTATANSTIIYAMSPGGANIAQPAVFILEEKDDNSIYNAIAVELDTYSSSSDKIGVASIRDTWSNASTAWNAITLASDSTKSKGADLFGTISLLDAGDTDSKSATISYPDNQVYAQLYMGAEGSVITAGTASAATQLGDVLVKDSEVTSVSTKNLIVIGGSCINSVAANLLGGASCGADFTTATGIGSGQFLIQSIASTYSTGKIALLVAGYEADDTVNAATYLRNQVVDTTAGKKYQGTSATSATLVTTSA